MIYIQVFIYLQLLDFLTTLLGLRMGLSELSPAVRLMTALGPEAGVGFSKVIALGFGGLCIWLNKRHVIRWINYWYAALIVWNLSLILSVWR
jgi:hypothetical protein